MTILTSHSKTGAARALSRRTVRRTLQRTLVLLLAAAVGLPGCMIRRDDYPFRFDTERDYFGAATTDIEYPDVVAAGEADVTANLAPTTLADDTPAEFWDMSLQECIRTALTQTDVLRDLGGQVLQSPDSVLTIQDPALQETDPRFGVDAALSAFDATFATSAFFEKNDRPLNNPFFGGGLALKQDLAAMESSISKRTAVGTDLTLRKTWEYDFNNTPGNPLSSAWNVLLDAEVRQPLLQGAGVEFGRIAGPGGTPGVFNGVLIARINTDISLADFEMGVRDLVNDVESTYWELYFAYRDLDARIAARERALETWRRIHALYVTGRRGGEAEKEAQAREQYFRLEEEVQNALSGRQLERTRTLLFRGTGGVHSNERRLRLLMGIPINDGRLLRPSDEPRMAKVVFDWDEILIEALTRRAELRRQQWQIKRRELELIVSRNYLYPQFDAVGRYRFRGFGKDLIHPSGGRPKFDNAFADLTTGDFQEWQLGFEFTLPIGFRQAHAAVRNAQLQLARAKAIFDEQQREVAHDLSSAIGEMDRAYAVSQTNFNRRLAGKQQLEALEAVYKDADESQKLRLLDLLLDAQRRLADAESRYYRSIVEYNLAVKQVHFQKGSLLDYNEIFLSEGPWPHKAGHDAARRDAMRGRPWRLTNFIVGKPPTISQGPYAQETAPGDEAPLNPDYSWGEGDDHEPAHAPDEPHDPTQFDASGTDPFTRHDDDQVNFKPVGFDLSARRGAAFATPASAGGDSQGGEWQAPHFNSTPTANASPPPASAAPWKGQRDFGPSPRQHDLDVSADRQTFDPADFRVVTPRWEADAPVRTPSVEQTDWTPPVTAAPPPATFNQPSSNVPRPVVNSRWQDGR